MAVDVIKKVKWDGNFLVEPHTLRHLKKAIFHTEVADTQTYDVWKEQGRKDIRARAREKAKTIISEHQHEHLTADMEANLREYVALVEQRA